MSELASVFLTGEILPGFLKDDVIPSLARLLKTDESKAALLLSGRETLVKRNVAPSDVDRYLQALRKAGAVARSSLERAPSAFPILSEDFSPAASAPASAPASPAPKTQPVPEPVELALAPGWSKPGEEAEQVAAFSSGVDQGVGARLSRPTGVSVPLRSRAPAVSRDVGREPVYADVPVFALSTRGRIGRLRYMAYFWPCLALLAGAGILAAVLVPAMASAKPGIGSIVLAVLVGIALLWLSVRLTALRLHDLNRSGKWVLLPIFLSMAAGAAGSPRLVLIASAVYWILTLALMAWPGSQDDNDYGPPPPPNSEWVYIGAALFLASGALSVVAMMRFDHHALDRFSHASEEDPDGDWPGNHDEAFLQRYAQQLDSNMPVMMNSMLSLDKVEYADGVLRYKATLQGRGLSIGEDDKDAMRKSMLMSYCGANKEGGLFPPAKVPVEFVFRYQVTAWDYDRFTLKLSSESC